VSDDSLVRQNAGRFCRQHVEPHLHALDHFPDEPLPSGFLEGIASLELEDLDTNEPEGLAMLAEAVRTMAEAAAAPAAIVLADAVARALPATAGERRLGACPLYADVARPTYRLALRHTKGGVEISGRVPFVVNAPVAAWMVLPAADAEDVDGTFLVHVDADQPGLTVGKPLLTLGMRGCPTADVVLTNAVVRPDRCTPLAPDAFERFFGPAAALVAGTAGASWRAATAYARERVQGGRPIVEHGEMRSMLAEMGADVSVCDMARRALVARDGIDRREAITLFLRARQAAIRVADLGVQVLGGNGYMEDYGQERRLRDARQGGCLLGRPDALRMEIADLI